MERIEIERIIWKLKKKIHQTYEKRQYETALKMVSLCASILYETNIYYMDSELEQALQSIAQALFPSENCKSNRSIVKEDTVLFYDEFGLDNRGLARIYLKAISENKKICYVTYKRRSQEIPEILNIVHSCGGSIYFLEKGKKNRSNPSIESDTQGIGSRAFFPLCLSR